MDRLGLPPFLNRLPEVRLPNCVRRLAWLTIFTIARKSLIYWTDGLP
jgi:hypothetical protein